MLKVVPAYVFTAGGNDVLADEDVVRLNVKRRKREYNREVFRHLVFWREVLARGGETISIDTGLQPVVIDRHFLAQSVNFGVFSDPGSFGALVEPGSGVIDDSADFEDEEDLGSLGDELGVDEGEA